MDLFDVTEGYHGGDPESADANKSIASSKSEIRGRILDWMRREVKDAICDEASEALHLKHQTCSARFTELKRSGLIEPTGQLRPTRSGCNAKVYRLHAGERTTLEFSEWMTTSMTCKLCKQEIPEGKLGCEDCMLRVSEREYIGRFTRGEQKVILVPYHQRLHIAIDKRCAVLCRAGATARNKAKAADMAAIEKELAVQDSMCERCIEWLMSMRNANK